MAFKALKIPESDSAWDNVRYRPTAPTIPTSVPAPPPVATSSSSRSSTSAQAEPKRPAITTKEAKLKSKHDAPRTKGEIQMKDESSKATVARVTAIKRAELDRPSTSDSGSSASRRHPGSGYQAKKTPQSSTAVTEKSGTPVDVRAASKSSHPASLPPKPPSVVSSAGETHARKTIPTMPPKPTKKGDDSDRERDREHERRRERELEKREREKEKQQEERERERMEMEMEKREKARQKAREAVEREKRQREKEREREEMDQEKRQREKERIPKERAAGTTAFKRKPASQDTEDTLEDASSKATLPKRRKLDDGSPMASSSSKARDAGLPGPKKSAHDPSPVPRLKMKKDPSPQVSTPSQERRATTSAGGSTHKFERPSKAGSAKLRRRSPIYTSSEDEGEIPQPRKRNASPPPVSDRSNSSDQPATERAPRHHRTTRTAYPPATDHAALRALYQSQYSNYLGAFSKIVAQKRKIEAMLKGDSEAELDVMDPDDLVKLSVEHQSLKTELENIHDLYTKGTTAAVGGGGAVSD